MKVHLLSFCVGLPDSDYLIERFRKQAQSCEYLDSVSIINESHEYYTEFYKKFNGFLKLNPRGHGYWLWKPFILEKFISSVDKGDVILYCDIGCELSPAGYSIFDEYIKLVKRDGFVVFSVCNGHPEYFWTKRELINATSAPQIHLEQEQIAATFFFVNVNKHTHSVISEWLEIASINNMILITDEIKIEQHPNFIEHRHDQSIFSLLMKRNNVSPVLKNFYFPPVLYYKNSYILKYPIHALRSKGRSEFINDSMYVFSDIWKLYLLKYFIILWGHKIMSRLKRYIKGLK